jgi:hypothetical protein
MNDEIINILTKPLERIWSVQGLGMMRTYLNETQRLHLWHRDLIAQGVTQLHDHPWDFSSEIIFGGVKQIRYGTEDQMPDLYLRNVSPRLMVNLDAGTDTYMKQKILCGEGSCFVGDPEEIKLGEGPMESYYEGQTYQQKAHEIHKSLPFDNTVTIITRSHTENPDHAHVYIPKGAEFGSAEPRPASRAEILFITREVLHAYQES